MPDAQIKTYENLSLRRISSRMKSFSLSTSSLLSSSTTTTTATVSSAASPSSSTIASIVNPLLISTHRQYAHIGVLLKQGKHYHSWNKRWMCLYLPSFTQLQPSPPTTEDTSKFSSSPTSLPSSSPNSSKPYLVYFKTESECLSHIAKAATSYTGILFLSDASVSLSLSTSSLTTDISSSYPSVPTSSPSSSIHSVPFAFELRLQASNSASSPNHDSDVQKHVLLAAQSRDEFFLWLTLLLSAGVSLSLPLPLLSSTKHLSSSSITSVISYLQESLASPCLPLSPSFIQLLSTSCSISPAKYGMLEKEGKLSWKSVYCRILSISSSLSTTVLPSASSFHFAVYSSPVAEKASNIHYIDLALLSDFPLVPALSSSASSFTFTLRDKASKQKFTFRTFSRKEYQEWFDLLNFCARENEKQEEECKLGSMQHDDIKETERSEHLAAITSTSPAVGSPSLSTSTSTAVATPATTQSWAYFQNKMKQRKLEAEAAAKRKQEILEEKEKEMLTPSLITITRADAENRNSVVEKSKELSLSSTTLDEQKLQERERGIKRVCFSPHSDYIIDNNKWENGQFDDDEDEEEDWQEEEDGEEELEEEEEVEVDDVIVHCTTSTPQVEEKNNTAQADCDDVDDDNETESSVIYIPDADVFSDSERDIGIHEENVEEEKMPANTVSRLNSEAPEEEATESSSDIPSYNVRTLRLRPRRLSLKDELQWTEDLSLLLKGTKVYRLPHSKFGSARRKIVHLKLLEKDATSTIAEEKSSSLPVATTLPSLAQHYQSNAAKSFVYSIQWKARRKSESKCYLKLSHSMMLLTGMQTPRFLSRQNKSRFEKVKHLCFSVVWRVSARSNSILSPASSFSVYPSYNSSFSFSSSSTSRLRKQVDVLCSLDLVCESKEDYNAWIRVLSRVIQQRH